MKKQVNLTQSDLYNVIKESVKNVILEFGTDPGKKGDENREKMAKAAKRAIKKGDSSVYQNAHDSIIKGGGNKETLSDFQKKFEDEDKGFNQQPSNVVTGEGRKPVKVTESQLFNIIKESVRRILQEEYTGDEPFVPNKYPGQIPKFNSKEEYRNWKRKEAPNDWFDWNDDRKCQRTGIQPGYSGLATRAMRDRRDGKMSWNNDKNYNKFQMLKQKNGIQ